MRVLNFKNFQASSMHKKSLENKRKKCCHIEQFYAHFFTKERFLYNMSVSSSKKALTIFSLTMITVGSVDSIRNLPATALFGSQLIFFFIFGALFFLVPCALVSAELASTYPKQGGIYVWVTKAFGRRAGFLAIWLQWIENVIWYPTLLSFVAGTIGYLISPNLANDPKFLVLIILCSFWGVTALNLYGMRSSAFFSSLCTLTGLLLPMTLIITLGAIWLLADNPLQISFDLNSIVPHLDQRDSWVSLTAIMMSFCGIEIATVHAADVDRPQRAFPIALAYSVGIILVTLILGSLAIAIVLPHNQISLVAGIMQAFDAFFHAYHLTWIMPLVALMLILGGLGGVNNWIIAPTKGLLVAAEDGNLPPAMCTINKNQAPTTLLVLQAVIVSVLCAVFLLFPSVNGAYWFLTELAAQLYMLMYLMMFITAIVLRVRNPNKEAPFKVPGGLFGLVMVCAIGIIGTIVTIFISFFPPSDVNVSSMGTYALALVAGIFVMCLPPLIGKKYPEVKTITSE